MQLNDIWMVQTPQNGHFEEYTLLILFNETALFDRFHSSQKLRVFHRHLADYSESSPTHLLQDVVLLPNVLPLELYK